MFGATKSKPPIPRPGELTWPFRLGDEVEDTYSGLKGIAVVRTYHLSGCDRFGVEMPPKDNEVSHFHTDASRLKLVTSHPERHRNEIPDGRINLGDWAKDTISGLTGTVTHISVPIIGAIQADIVPDYNAKLGKIPDGYFVDEHLVEVLTPYTPAPVPAPTPVPQAAKPAEKPERGSMPLGRGQKL